MMEHCLGKVEDVNGDQEPPFPFFNACMCGCAFIYFIHISVFTLSHGPFKFVKFIVYFILILLLLILMKK